MTETTLPAEVIATEEDLRAIAARHLPGYELVKLPEGETPYCFHAGDDTYVVWVVAKNVPLADGSDARCVTLSRREKRVISIEE